MTSKNLEALLGVVHLPSVGSEQWGALFIPQLLKFFYSGDRLGKLDGSEIHFFLKCLAFHRPHNR